MKDAVEYLGYLRALILRTPEVRHWHVIREEAQGSAGLLRYREEILALADLQLTTEQQEALSDLLTRNRESTLNVEGRRRLDELMSLYEQGLLRKAQALRVAVQRGLREPLQP